MNRFFEQTKKVASNARQASIANLNAASKSLSQASGASIQLTTAKTTVELNRMLKEEAILLEGSVWKRRGGLGKLVASYSSAWESRHVQLLANGVLLYFDSDPAKALSSSNDPQELLRGYLDLVQENASVQTSFGHSGSPSPFCLSIKVTVGLAQETKWKLAFDRHQDQMEWLTAISDVSIQASVDTYNKSLLEAAIPKGQEDAHKRSDAGGGLLRSPPVYEPGVAAKQKTATAAGGGIDLGIPAAVSTPHQLWMTDDYVVRKKTTLTSDQQEKNKASVNTALQVMERLLAEERNQHAMADEKVKALHLQVEGLQQEKETAEASLQQATVEKESLQEELSIRISTHDLDMGVLSGSPDEHDTTPETEETDAAKSKKEDLESQVQALTNNLHAAKQSLEDLGQEKESLQAEMDQKVAGLETKLFILQEEHQALQEKNNANPEQDSTPAPNAKDETDTDSSRVAELEGQVESLQSQLDQARKEYQESLQTLASDFTAKLELAEQTKKETTGSGSNGEAEDSPSMAIEQMQSESSGTDEEFEDAMEEIIKSPKGKGQ